ncbi:MAG: PPC domain-containing DNA-binding protein [Halobacteriota archaeon]|nr:PPC domain-containing DNA-binding protein [Halobacteriota archaeon]
MKLVEEKGGREFLIRMDHDADLLDSIHGLADSQGIRLGIFTGIGALKEAEISYYDQARKEYIKNELNGPLEIANLVGNISIKEEKIFVHAHAILSERDGRTYSGHFERGKIFACELYIRELVGEELVRSYDDTTGLFLWRN